jgi:DNA-directed RNA polymerase specialized sigma24 family protein
VLAALRTLPEAERSVLLMATLGDVPHEAIAVAFGITPAAVKVRVYRARLKLNAARLAKESS